MSSDHCDIRSSTIRRQIREMSGGVSDVPMQPDPRYLQAFRRRADEMRSLIAEIVDLMNRSQRPPHHDR